MYHMFTSLYMCVCVCMSALVTMVIRVSRVYSLKSPIMHNMFYYLFYQIIICTLYTL